MKHRETMDKQFIINILKQYVNGSLNVQDISDFTFEVISSDDVNVAETDRELVYDIISYLDNVDNEIFPLSKADAEFLISTLKSVKDEKVALEMVTIIKFRDKLIESLQKLSNDQSTAAFRQDMNKLPLENKTIVKLTKYLKTKENINVVISLLENGNADSLAKIIK